MATLYELKRLSDFDSTIKLSEDEAQAIIKSIDVLSKHMHTYFHYQITKRNLFQLLQYIDSCQNRFEYSDILECNRFLFNFVDTFYSYINYFESQYKDTFQSVKSFFYDYYFDYAFIYNLRNYMIHEDLPVYKERKEIFQDRIENKFIISKQVLLNSSRLQKNFKPRFKKTFININEIDIFQSVVHFSKILLEIQKKMLMVFSKELTEHFMFLKKYVQKEEVYLIKDGEIQNGLLNVLSKYYQSMADNFVCVENLVDTTDVGELFAKISEIY